MPPLGTAFSPGYVRAFWRHGRTRPLYGIVIALVAVLGVFALRYALHDVFDDRAVFMLFMPAIVLAAMFGGLLPGVVAIVMAVTMANVLQKVVSIDSVSSIDLVAFTVAGTSIALLGEGFLRSTIISHSTAEALNEREAQLRAILDTAFDAAILIEANGTVISYNPAAERQFGYSRNEIIGRNVCMLMSEPYRSEHDGYIGRYLATGERRIIGSERVVVGQRKDSSTFPMKIAIGEVYTEGTRYFTGFVRDLTERAESAARLEEVQNELARLSRLNELGEMASMLAHELNQPLSATVNYVQGSSMLLSRIDSPTVRPARIAMAEAIRQALRAGDIVRHLREYVVRGETQKLAESMHRMIEGAAGLALMGSRNAGVRTQLQLRATRDRVLADRIQIQQVLVNLLRNALDAMRDQPRRELTIRTMNDDESRNVIVEVADTGPGIEEDKAERLFQPFVTTKASGIGVGLSISRRLIVSHGGTLGVFVNEDGGATFRFSLPLLATEDNDSGR